MNFLSPKLHCLAIVPTTSFICLFFLLPAFAAAQKIDFGPQQADNSVTITLDSLPVLEPVVRSEDAKLARIPPPHYEYLWVFSDGEFINQSLDSVVSHTFIGKNGTQGTVSATAFTTGVYSDDHLDLPPDKRKIPGTKGDPVTFADLPRQQVVTNGFIRLSSNHRGFVAKDRPVFIISIKNPTDSPLTGYLFFFSDPRIEIKKEGEAAGDVSYEPFRDDGGNLVSATFDEKSDLAPRDGQFGMNEIQQDWLPKSLTLRYTKVYRDTFFILGSQEERHYFVQFRADEDLLEKGPAEEKGALRFVAAVVVDGQLSAGPGGFLNPQDSALVEELAIPALLDSLNSNDQPSGREVAGLASFEAEITASHDPNYLKTEICECPQGSDGAYKLFTTVHFSNEGNAPTNDIAVSVTFPPEYDIFSIPDTLLSIYPRPDSAVLAERDPATNTVRWNLAGFQLFPENDFGLGHPLTYGEFQFTVLVNPTDKKVESIPFLQACIEFDGQSEICTVPVKPVVAEGAAASDILACGSCVSNPQNGGGGGIPDLPWWLWLLLLIILIILGTVAAIRRRLFGGGQGG